MDFACPIPVHGHPVDCGFVELGYFKVFILGIVQGITELLPISSTAHLRIIPSLLGWHDPGTPFTGAAQLASFFAVMVYFRKEIGNIFFGTVKSIQQRNFSSFDFKLGIGILIATIPVGICGLLFAHILNRPGTPLRSLYVIGGASVVMGFLLIVAEKFSKFTRPFEKITLRDSILVGLAQTFALIPGVSRSGSTLTAGLFLGLTRETAAAFSFILGIPVIVLAGLKEILELYRAGLESHGWGILAVGIGTASVAAFLAVFSLMSYLEKKSTYLFAWYRLSLGIMLIAGSYFGWLH
jgi:undecaprenyl-diphosphatase